MLNHKHQLIKESTVFLSGRISQFNHLIDTFELAEDNPIRKSAELVTNDYITLSESIGKLGKALEKVTNEILNFEDQ